jgi:taurine dioxygenase
MNATISVKPVAGALGAEIFGYDLGAGIDGDQAAAIRKLLLEYGVIFFRGQTLDDTQFKAFARCFGDFFRHPYLIPEGDPNIITIRRAPGDRHIVGEDWHSDTPAVAAPPMASILYGDDIPPYGGDTVFGNQYRAYEALSPAMQRMLGGLRAVYSDTRVTGANVTRNQNSATQTRQDDNFRHSEGVHPVVRTHPETGRKALYLIRPLFLRFDGMTAEESDGLLQYLYRHSIRPEFTCRFRWQKGSIAFWDNRCVQHIAVNDTPTFHRVMRRVQLEGDVPA